MNAGTIAIIISAALVVFMGVGLAYCVLALSEASVQQYNSKH